MLQQLETIHLIICDYVKHLTNLQILQQTALILLELYNINMFNFTILYCPANLCI